MHVDSRDRAMSPDGTTRGTSKTFTILAGLVLLLAPAFADLALAQASTAELPGFVSRQSADDYRARARYPDHARALAATEVDPVLSKRVPTPHSLPNPGTDGLLTLWSGEVTFQAGEPVELFVAVTGLERGRTAGTTVTGEVLDSQGNFVRAVTYRDDGRGVDERAHDGTFSARFRMPESAAPELAESFLVKVRATKPDGEVLLASGGFLYADPHARLTGDVSHGVRDGDLVLSVEVEVERPGRYHLAGTLTDMQGEPVAWAQTARQLEAGTHRLELPYYGLIFHDRGVAGPFRIASLGLSNVSAMPNAMAPLVEDAGVIPALPLARLTRHPFDHPDLLETAKRLEAEADAAVLGGAGGRK